MHIEGERQANNCATADGILRPDTTAVEFHESFADGKPQTTPRFYGPVPSPLWKGTKIDSISAGDIPGGLSRRRTTRFGGLITRSI